MLYTNISLDSPHHSNTFAKTYYKFMMQIYKLMWGNLDTIFDLDTDFKGRYSKMAAILVFFCLLPN